jgi:hypothetical protein
MKNTNHCLGIVLFLASCKEDAAKPKVTYDAEQAKSIVKVDSTQIQIADLPWQMEGTDYLIHPIADLSIRDRALNRVMVQCE